MIAAAPLKAYLFNDTSRSRHAGCKAVMRSLRAELSAFADVIATHTVGSAAVDAAALAAYASAAVTAEGFARWCAETAGETVPA